MQKKIRVQVLKYFFTRPFIYKSTKIDVALPWKCLPHLQWFSTRYHGFQRAIFAKLQFKSACTITKDYFKKISRYAVKHCI